MQNIELSGKKDETEETGWTIPPHNVQDFDVSKQTMFQKRGITFYEWFFVVKKNRSIVFYFAFNVRGHQ